ncbi:MAG: hypothetical protein KKB62_00760 [Nanoarchaeota archaeon]|nr:hypothetical protein [Nanoarchaeota archaeon]
MEKEDLNSLKSLIDSLESNLSKMKDAMRNLDKTKFNNLKSESVEISKKIEGALGKDSSKNKK